jgi:hypothetical protein
MAMKDWKQEGENRWIRKNDTIEIIKNYDKNGDLKYYTIEIYLFETENSMSKWLNTRRFSKEKMAIKYAREYMRRN